MDEARVSLTLETEKDFTDFVENAPAGTWARYHVAPKGQPLSSVCSRVETYAAARRYYDEGAVELTQRRLPNGRLEYLAVKRHDAVNEHDRLGLLRCPVGDQRDAPKTRTPPASAEFDIISRAEAQARGLKYYFTGSPCRNGHVAQRKTVSRSCVECDRDYQLAYPGADRAKARLLA